MKSSLYSSAEEQALKDGDAKEMMEAAKGCNIDIKQFNSIVFGTDGKDGVAAVITAPGIGEEANLNCISDKVKEKKGEAPFTIEGNVLKMAKEDGTAYIVDGKTLAFATSSWAGAVKDLIDGKGTSAFDGPNKDIFAKADKSKHIWFAGKVPAEMASGPAEGLESAVGSLDFSSGLALQATATFADAEKATALQDMAKGGLAMGKGMAESKGIPGSVVDGVEIVAKGKDLNASVTISKEDLDKINESLKGMMGGM
ncbi:MAG: hypothetical protein H6713_06975 [Myxococcales bacterium]|nr:hypothetical protein [Myxococcales bacterium]MCB9749736.1 hypothetical protein [Myxococcales bacterium]